MDHSFPRFWKLSQGGSTFTHQEMLQSINDRLVSIHANSGLSR